MAAARQREIKVSATVVATTTFAVDLERTEASVLAPSAAKLPHSLPCWIQSCGVEHDHLVSVAAQQRGKPLLPGGPPALTAPDHHDRVRHQRPADGLVPVAAEEHLHAGIDVLPAGKLRQQRFHKS